MREFRSESIESQTSSCSLSSPILSSISVPLSSSELLSSSVSELPKFFEDLSQEDMINHILISAYSP